MLRSDGRGEQYRLSRFVSVRADGKALIAESLLSGHTMRIANASVLKLLLAFMSPMQLGRVLGAVDGARRPTLRAFLERCCASSFLVPVDEDGRCDEDAGSLAHWEFTDLMFHVRGRLGRNRAPCGATWRLRGVVPPEPAVRSRPADRTIDLYRPNLAELARTDVTLTQALESRRTIYSTSSVDARRLGEFLYRTCRVTGWKQAENGGRYVLKVHPSGGSLHPIEVYVVVSACDGLASGVYRYDAVDHRLASIADLTADAQTLLEQAQRATAGKLPGFPPVLFVFAARFRRTAFKYQAIAYRVILQEVGTILQTMYLVASSMQLAPAAIGIGDSDLFARVIGSDYYSETSVGEFILGGPPDASDR